MDDSRRKLLLILVAVLAALRFIVVPLMQSQDAKREQLEVTTQRLDRSQGVVENRAAILEARKTLAAGAEALRERIPTVQGGDAYRLQAQRRIGQMARRSGVQLRVTDWILDGTDKDSGLAYGRLRMQMEGSLRNLVLAHAQLEGELDNAVFRDVKVTVRGGATAPADTAAEMTLLANVYYRLAPTVTAR